MQKLPKRNTSFLEHSTDIDTLLKSPRSNGAVLLWMFLMLEKINHNLELLVGPVDYEEEVKVDGS